MQSLPAGRWVLHTCLGGALGLVLGVALSPLTMLLGFGAGVGLGVGLMQARLLSREARAGGAGTFNSVGWVLVSVAGGALPGWLLAFALIMGGSNGGVPVDNAAEYIGGVSAAAALFGGVAGALCGAVVGIVQGLMLGRRAMAAVLSWAALSGVGWGLSWAALGGGLGLAITSGQAGGIAPVLIVAGGLLALGAWAPFGLITAPFVASQDARPRAAAGASTEAGP